MALRGLSSPNTARGGNIYGIAGMVIAIATTLAMPGVVSYAVIALGVIIGGIIGSFIALRIQMTALPQLVAAFHTSSLIEMSLGTAIGAVTFTGSIIAFGKLQGLITGKPLVFPGQHILNALLGVLLVVVTVLFDLVQSAPAFWAVVVLSLVLGFLLFLPIGGADMPVVISMLNSYSGWAACGIGFTLSNSLLIITGALVGSSGAILSYIMCKGMNRSIFNVILGGFGTEGGTAAA